MTRRWQYVVLLIVVLAGGASWWLVGRSRQESRQKVTVVVRLDDLVVRVEALGRAELRRQVNLSFPAGGLVIELPVAEGDSVEAGTPVATLETDELETRLREAELNRQRAQARLDKAVAGAPPAEVEVAQARVQQALLAFEAAAAQYDEVRDRPDAEISDEALRLEAARAELAAARAALRRAVEGASPEERALLEAELELADLRVERARRALENATLRAPFAGVIARVHVAQGERVGPNQPVVTLADPTSLRVVAEVDEIDIPRLRVGQPVTVRFDAFPTRPVSGTVEHIAYTALAQRGSTTFPVTVILEENDLPVRPGMNATVTVEAQRLSGVLIVPLRAVRYAGPEAFVVRRRGQVEEEVPVVVGGDDGVNVAILDGVDEGDVIVLPEP